MSTATPTRSRRQRPRSFTLVAPPGWIRVDLDAPPRVDPMLDAVVDAARSQHASLCALYAQVVGSTVISASLIAATVRANEAVVRDGAVDIAALHSQVAAFGGSTQVLDSHVVELRAGRAVRVRLRPELTVDGRTLHADNVQFLVPAPGGDAILVATFSTPSRPLAEAFCELFDAMAGSIEWVW